MLCCHKIKVLMGYTQEKEWYVIMIANDLIPCECHPMKWFSLKVPFSLEEWIKQWKQCQDVLFQNKNVNIVWKTNPETIYKMLVKSKSMKVVRGEIT